MNIWEKSYSEKGIDSQREYPNESLIAFVKGNFKKGDRILEIGCGSGANMWFLAKEGYKSYGIDYSETGIKLCKKKLIKEGYTADLRMADMKNLPFPDGYFDAIVDVVSLQHEKDKRSVLKEVFRCLKPNGKFFSYHASGGDFDKVFSCFDFYFPDGIETIAKEIGFKSIQIDKHSRTYDNEKYKVIYSIIILNKN